MFDYLKSLPGDKRSQREILKTAFAPEVVSASSGGEDEQAIRPLDSTAVSTIEEIFAQLIVEESPAILDLAAGRDSHLPDDIQPVAVVGLGACEEELAANPALSERVVHDLNECTELPFADELFDAVVCTAAIEYIARPLDVFAEVSRVLRPGGLLAVVFSNRFVKSRATRIWRELSEAERPIVVADLFNDTAGFGQPRVFVSRTNRRAAGNGNEAPVLGADPVYAVYAEKWGGPDGLRRVFADRSMTPYQFDEEEIVRRKQRVGETLRCPYCDEKLAKWEVPDTPFIEWSSEYQYICFNDQCCYFARGWTVMAAQGNPCSYRFMYDPPTGGCHPMAVLSNKALRECIVVE